MFLAHAERLGFLKLDPESQVFMVFPIAARKTLAQTTTECLLRLNPHPDLITTSSHMRSLMEIVGQAFDLPFDAESAVEDGTAVVASALDVYKLWLCSATYQPAPVREDPEFFTSRMLRHISLVFRPRHGSIDRHIQIGRKALDVYVQVAREAGPLFSDSTWDEFLKLFLAVADSLLSQDVDAVPLADRLQAHVLRVLFEIFVLSRSQNEDTWGIWKMLMQNWRHRIATITAWTGVLFGMVQRVLGITYGETVGSPNISFTVGEVPVSLETDDDHAIYVMFKVLHLMGDLDGIADPGIYNEAMRGMAFLSSSLINVQNKMKNLGMVIPDGNSLLHLLGPILLEATTKFPRRLEHGKATAIEAVTKLFLRKASVTEFHVRYLAMFYHGLESALKSGSAHLLSVVLLQCQKLFGSNFKGINMLMPSFLAAVTNVLASRTQLQGLHGTMMMLRRSSLNIVIQLVCWPNLYSSMAFKTRDPLRCEADLPEIVSFEDMNAYISFALMRALETVESQNYALLFHAAFLYAMENFDRDVTFARDFLREVLQMMVGFKYAGRALQFVCLFSPLIIGLSRFDKTSLLDALRFIDDLSIVAVRLNELAGMSSPVVQALCSLLLDLFDLGQASEAPPDEAVCAALFGLRRWLTGSWIVQDRELLRRLWLTVNVCSSGVAGFHFPSERVQDAASSTMHFLLCHLGQASDPEFSSTLMRELDAFERYRVSPGEMLCFIVDGLIYSLVTHPKRPDRLSCTLFVRSPAGVASWDMCLNYFPQPVVEPAPFAHNDSPLLPDIQEERSLPDETMGALLTSLPEPLRELHMKLEERVLESVMVLDELRAQLLAEPLGMPPMMRLRAAAPVEGVWENTVARIAMATLGFSSPTFLGRMHMLPSNKVEEALDFFDRLDTLPSRECYRIGLAYVCSAAIGGGNGLSSTVDESAGETGAMVGSPEFEEFVRSLGIMATVARHPEMELDPVLVGEEFLLTCDLDVALAYVSKCWMPVEEELQEDQARFLGDLDVMVCWCEDADEVRQRARAVYTICIEPLPSRLFRIRVLMKSGAFLPGPLVDGAVVSQYLLPCALTRTVINMSRAARKDPFFYCQTHVKRKLAIEEFIHNHTTTGNITHAWATMCAN